MGNSIYNGFVMNPYENLANAIVKQAADDYRVALEKLKVCPKDTCARSEKRSCEKFFQSLWFKTLTSVEGEYIVRKVQQEVDEYDCT